MLEHDRKYMIYFEVEGQWIGFFRVPISIIFALQYDLSSRLLPYILEKIDTNMAYKQEIDHSLTLKDMSFDNSYFQNLEQNMSKLADSYQTAQVKISVNLSKQRHKHYIVKLVTVILSTVLILAFLVLAVFI